MKQLSNYIAESLLDTEDEIFDRMDLNIFSIISDSKSEDEFYEKLNELKDLCIAVKIDDDLSKYKNSFFLMELMTSYSKKNHGVKIDKYFKKTKKPLFVNYFQSVGIHTAISTKLTFNELKYEYTPGLKSDTVYVFPKDIEKQYVEWVTGLPAKYLRFAEKSKVL